MSASDLRKKYMRELAGMSRYARATAWVIVGGYLALILLSIGLGAWLLEQPRTPWSVAGIIGLVLFIGTRIRGINNIIHECSHATFSAHRPDNVLIGRLCSALLLGSYKDYCDEHLSHHVHLGNYENDKDFGALQALGLHDPLTPRVILRHVLTPLTGRHLRYYLKGNLSGRDGRGWQAVKFALVGATLVLSVMAPAVGFLFVIVPFALVFTAINYWTDCLDHGGIFAASDELDASRNVLAPGWLQLLLFPRHDGYHLVHHLFPHVPARHLARAHERLLSEDAYRRRANASGLASRPEMARPRGGGSNWAVARLARASSFFSF